jgi:sensor histidine kinase YesM
MCPPRLRIDGEGLFVKKTGIRGYLFFSAVLLLCAGCLISIILCSVVSRHVMRRNMMENCCNQLEQVDASIEQTYTRARQRIESIANDANLRALLYEISPLSSSVQIFRQMTKIESLINSSLYGADDLTSFYLVTDKGTVAIDDIWLGSRVVMQRHEVDDIYQALLGDYGRFIEVESTPQQRIFQPIGKRACMVALLDYDSAFQGHRNLLVESREGQLLYSDMPFDSAAALQKAHPRDAQLCRYESAKGERVYWQALSPDEMSYNWMQPLRIIVPVSVVILLCSAVFLYAYSGRINRPIRRLGEMLKTSDSRAFHDTIKAYVDSFQGAPSMRSMVLRFYLFSLIPLTLIVFIHTAVYQQSLYSALVEQNENRLTLVEENITREINGYLYLARFISFNDDIKEQLLGVSRYGHSQAKSELPQLLLGKGLLGQNILNVAFYDDAFETIYNGVESARDSNLPLDEWKAYFATRSAQVQWVVSSWREDIITLVWRVRYLPGDNNRARAFWPIGYIRFDISGMFGGVSSAIRGNQPLLYSIDDALGRPIVDHIGEQPVQFFRTVPIKNTPWTLRLAFDPAALRRDSLINFLPNALVWFGSLLILLLTCWLLSRRIQKPMDHMQRGIVRDDADTLLAVQTLSSISEFSLLAHSFEDMINRMEAMNRELTQKRIEGIEFEKREKAAELAAMQMQINPHFLYNIFSSIQFLLLAKENERAAQMIKAVGEFMRKGLYRGSQKVALRTELSHADAYVQLQSLRYGAKLRFSSDVDEQLLEIAVPRFILQPLIENSIEHGFPRKRTLEIHLRIQSTPDGQVEICVEDNGTGIASDAIKRIEQSVREGVQYEHIGLVNIYERLRLCFGDSSTFEISSRPNVLTIIKLRFEQYVEV